MLRWWADPGHARPELANAIGTYAPSSLLPLPLVVVGERLAPCVALIAGHGIFTGLTTYWPQKSIFLLR